MSLLRKHPALSKAVLTTVVIAGIPAAYGSRMSAPPRFTALDHGEPVVQHVLVTAMSAAADGTIYAGGNYTVPNNAPYANQPISLLGSVWLVSHDHGSTWTKKISTSNPRSFPKSGIAPWNNHRMLPLDFTPASITVDPHNPRVIYVAGCTDTGGHAGPRCALPLGGPMVVRSTDGGQTWQTSLNLSTIEQTPALRMAYQYSGAHPTQGYALVVDPRNSQHLYAAVSGLGVLRSLNAGRTWIYVSQPQSNQVVRPCELLFDPHSPNVLYELDRAGALYRSTDSGTHWAIRAPLNRIVGGTSSSLTLVGKALFVTASKGLYTSNDGGMHWRLVYPVPLPGGFDQSVHGSSGWITTFEPLKAGATAGLYAKYDRGMWQPVADTTKRGRQTGGALDFVAMGTYLVTRLWEDHTTRIVFTSAPLGGLYRWQGSI